LKRSYKHSKNRNQLLSQHQFLLQFLILFQLPLELLFQLPFFFVGFRAFYERRNWIRIPGIAYGAHTATTLVPILAEILTHDEFPSEAARWQLFLIYLPYLVIPAMIAVALSLEEKPFGEDGDGPDPGASAKRRKSKRG